MVTIGMGKGIKRIVVIIALLVPLVPASAAVAKRRDRTPPTVTMTSPVGGSTVSGSTTLAATASDNVRVDHVTFFIDGTVVGSDYSSPYSTAYDTTKLSNGGHTFSTRAADASGNVSTDSQVTATVSNTAQPPPPPPTSGDAVYSWGFDQPTCANTIWATSSWLSNACAAPAWYTEGIYYSVADASSPTGTSVLTQAASGVDSSGTWQAWVHNPLTVNGVWGSQHRVDLTVKPIRWGSQAQANCSWAGGPKIFMGRQADVYETSTYTIELSICEGHAYIQKKSWGINDCGKDPRAVDCGAGGTWYNLKTVNIPPAAFGVWHTYTGIKRDNPDGSVTLIGIRDGVELLRYTEVPNSISLGPLRGGREGWRSNMIDWHMDNYKVTVSP
jgi:hypothetical protein